jgi:hypothetical protein
MAGNVMKRLKLREQLSGDPFKIFVLVERNIMVSLLMVLVFVFMEELSLKNDFSGWEVVGGTIGYLAVTAKKMYFDDASSELRVRTNMEPSLLRNAMLSIGYSEQRDGVYCSDDCKSEVITCTIQRSVAIFTGPYNRLVTLSRALQ